MCLWCATTCCRLPRVAVCDALHIWQLEHCTVATELCAHLHVAVLVTRAGRMAVGRGEGRGDVMGRAGRGAGRGARGGRTPVTMKPAYAGGKTPPPPGSYGDPPPQQQMGES